MTQRTKPRKVRSEAVPFESQEQLRRYVRALRREKERQGLLAYVIAKEAP